MRFIILFFLIFSSQSHAGLANEIKCQAKQDDFSVEIQLNENLKATVKYTLHEGKKKSVYMCGARIVKNRNETDGVVPKLVYGFVIDKCSPELPSELRSELIEDPNLVVKLLKAEDGYTGLLQWLNKFQPNDCMIKKFDLSKFTKHKDKL